MAALETEEEGTDTENRANTTLCILPHQLHRNLHYSGINKYLQVLVLRVRLARHPMRFSEGER